jgi:serine/threonine protein kinase
LGRYELLRPLARGGMAEVYLARRRAAGIEKWLVVKRMRPERSGDPRFLDLFVREARLSMSLVHQNIVPVFDFGKVDDEYFLAQEYILGRDLGRVNRRAVEREGRPLPLPQVFYVAHEVLKALDYAHNRIGADGKPLQLVHRDVSPNNILLSGRGEVKLFDFGVAKAQGRITQTQFGMVKGNVRFMSPEQARGDAVDGRSDLFSLGLVLYYALAGDSLYEADTAYNLLVRAAQGPGAKEHEKLRRLPNEAQRVLDRALRADAADRFQSAAEFAQALGPFMGGAHDGLARTMERLFGEDIRAEEARFATAAAVAETASHRTQSGRFAAPGKPNG